MDIDLLAKMIRDVVLEKDEVALPGLGVFVAEFVPASFSDKGYTINPPYKRLSFRQKDNQDDRTIVKLYAEANNIDEDTAGHFVNDFLSGLKDMLMLRKLVVFPGLGKLRATKENNFFFIADENLDIYPEGFGLEPVSLKTHQETVSEVAETMAGLRSILEPEPVIDPEPVIEPEAVKEPADVPASIEDSGLETVPEIVPGPDPEVESESEIASDAAPEIVSGQVALMSASVEPAVDAVEEPAEDAEEPAEDAGDPAEDSPVEPAKEEAAAESNIVHPLDIQIEESSADKEAFAQQDGDNEEQTTTDGEAVGQELLSEILVIDEDAKAAEEDADVAEEDINDTAGEDANPVEEVRHLVDGSEHSGDEIKLQPGGSRFWKVFRIIAVTIVIVAILALAAFIILSRVAPDFIDTILYSPEELEIVRKMTAAAFTLR